MGIKKQLGKKIKKLRIKKGLTQEKLAEMVDISQRTLSGIEIGENFMTADTLDRILKSLEVTADELFALEHIKETSDLINEIIEKVRSLEGEPEKIETIYKITSAIMKE